MLLMVEKVCHAMSAEVCHAIHWHAKAYNKYMKCYSKKESS